MNNKSKDLEIVFKLIDKRIRFFERESKKIKQNFNFCLLSHDMKSKLYELHYLKSQIISTFNESVIIENEKEDVTGLPNIMKILSEGYDEN